MVSPAADDVRAQLERLVSSPVLSGSARLRRFLTYIVERTLAGEGAQLKEYAIGVDVFDRDGEYDPRIDSIVRVEAGRLRAKLEDYYSGAGAADSLVITIPRGSYVPVFQWREMAAAAPSPALANPVASPRPWMAAVPVTGVLILTVLLGGLAAWARRPAGPRNVPDRITVAVLPFDHYSRDPADALLATRITDEITSGLARDGRVDVVSRTSARQFAGARRLVTDIARDLGADVIIEGSVTMAGEDVRVQTRFVNGLRGLKAGVLDFTGTRADLDALLRRVIQSVADAAPKANRGASGR